MAGVCVRFRFVGQFASSSAVVLRAAVISSLSACPMPPHVGVSSQPKWHSDAAGGTPHLFPANGKPFLPARLQWQPKWASMCAHCRSQCVWWRASVLVSASTAMLSAPRSSCYEQMPYPPSQRVSCLLVLALDRSSAFLSDATCGTPLFPANGKPPVSCRPGCSGSPSGHPCARLAGLSTAGGRRQSSFLLRRPCCQLLGRHATSRCHLLLPSVFHAYSCWR